MNGSKPKIMIADIETSPNVGYFWRPGYNLTITPDNIVEERKIICIAWKYMGQKKVHSVQWDKNHDDKKLLKEFSKAMNECDVMVFHNGDAFDIKWIKGRLLHHRLAPVTNVVSIDTLKLSRQNFNVNSHKLDYLAKYLGHSGKIHTDYSLWKKVMNGDKAALDYMVKYCKKDVVELEEVFVDIIPYCDKLPVNMAILMGNTRDDCPICASAQVIKYGVKVSRVGRYQKYQCKHCAHIFTDNRMLKENKQ